MLALGSWEFVPWQPVEYITYKGLTAFNRIRLMWIMLLISRCLLKIESIRCVIILKETLVMNIIYSV